MRVALLRGKKSAIHGAIRTRAAAHLLEPGGFRVNVADINLRFWGLGLAFAARLIPGIQAFILPQ
jgi:hypothetical protein